MFVATKNNKIHKHSRNQESSIVKTHPINDKPTDKTVLQHPKSSHTIHFLPSFFFFPLEITQIKPQRQFHKHKNPVPRTHKEKTIKKFNSVSRTNFSPQKIKGTQKADSVCFKEQCVKKKKKNHF